MNMVNKNSLALFATALILGLAGPVVALGATAPTLGSLSTFGIVSETSTNSNTAPETIINGSVCGTTLTAPRPLTITGGAEETPCAPVKGTDQSAALATINGQACTSIGAAVDLNAITIGANPPGTFPPGCYSSTGTMNIVTGTTVTLNATAPGGDGGSVWIFRPGGALTSGANSLVTLANGANARNVFWAPVGATTLGANAASSPTPTFVGNIFRGNAAGLSISLGHFLNLLGRTLAFGSTVTTDANTITVPPPPATLHVVKVVVNGGGGTAVPSDFSLTVKSGGVNVAGSPAAGVAAPGTSYTLNAGTYVVDETANPAYTKSFSGDCNAAGSVTLAAGEDKTCTITNNQIIAAPATLHIVKVVVNSSGGTAVPASFVLRVKNSSGVDVASPAPGVSAPGTSFSLAAGTYTLSEDANSLYTRIITGDCSTGGIITLVAGEDKTCTIVNTDIPITFGNGSFLPVPLINVTKIPNPLDLPSGPGPVIYTYTATNVGTVPMHGVWVRDNKCASVLYVSGDTNGDSLLDTNESWIYRCTKTVSVTETNTATAHGQANGWDAYDVANATVVVGAAINPPLIRVIKKPSTTLLTAGGGPVVYSYTVTNPGTAPLSNVSITDNKCTGLPGRVVGHPGDLNQNNLLESNESWSFTCLTNLTQTTTNIGTVVGYANGLVATDLSLATVAVATPGLPSTGTGPGEKVTRGEAVSAFHRSLSMGSKGADVTVLQTALTQKGYLNIPNGVAYGYYGGLTRAAVAKYQSAKGLPSVGVFGPRTRAMLIAELED